MAFREIATCVDLFWGDLNSLSYSEWLNEVTYLIDFNHIGVIGKGFSDKLLPFDIGLNKLKKKKFQNINGITLILNPEESDSPTYDWDVHFAYIDDFGNQQMSLCLNKNFKLISEFDSIIFSLLEKGRFKYGYIHEMPFSEGPECYGDGVVYGKVSKDQQNKMTAWYNYKFTGEINRIRDLYPINFFNKSQLGWKSSLKDQSLEQYFHSKNVKLQELYKDFFLVKIDKNKIESMIKDLENLDLIL